MADPILEATRPEKARDRELSHEDQDLGLENAKLRVEPVRAVGNCRGRRLEVAVPGAVSPGKAAHERGDVCELPKLLGAREAGPHHPPVELLAGTTGKRPARLALHGPGRLPNQEEGRAPRPGERGRGLRDDALVDPNVAGGTRGLECVQLSATVHLHAKLAPRVAGGDSARLAPAERKRGTYSARIEPTQRTTNPRALRAKPR